MRLQRGFIRQFDGAYGLLQCQRHSAFDFSQVIDAIDAPRELAAVGCGMAQSPPSVVVIVVVVIVVVVIVIEGPLLFFTHYDDNRLCR
jgi:hypothetical protein